jgi:hypothetical protein
MGKPWAPAVAYLFLQAWDGKVAQKLAAPTVVFRRDADDIFMVFSTKEETMACLSIMRATSEDIKIGDHQIGTLVIFLDLTIEVHRAVRECNANSRFATHIYRKPSDLRTIFHLQSAVCTSSKWVPCFLN